MLIEIKFERKMDDNGVFSPTIVFKEPVTFNEGDELVIVCADGVPVFVAIRQKNSS